ncbi:MAG: 4-oxalomesaconate tautomerase [Rhodospirillaceae bacterium]|jgi:4-oxalomesaconate tautomerase|nr:4-oxalomesaconate tautomerase [Rhodospirillaceae bacterium]
MQKSIPCTMMRGGTSKGAYFLKSDLPENEAERDRVLLSVMGSPDDRQIDGLGGANPLTSKVAIVSKSDEPDVDIDYLFAQVVVDQPVVGYGQNCGNILAGVGQFAIEKGLIEANSPTTEVAVLMLNSGDKAVVTVPTPNGEVSYEGDAEIDGVPGCAAPVPLNFLETAGSLCGALLPTGNVVDEVDGIELTLIDNGMPVVVMRARDFGVEGTETVDQLEANEDLKKRLESIRLQVGPLMNLGDVTDKTVPKMTLVSAPQSGGVISTRSFIPHRCHSTIGVFAAVTVATACLIPGTPAAEIAGDLSTAGPQLLIEHPSGAMAVDIEVEQSDGEITLKRSGFMRTARKLYEGQVFISE